MKTFVGQNVSPLDLSLKMMLTKVIYHLESDYLAMMTFHSFCIQPCIKSVLLKRKVLFIGQFK